MARPDRAQREDLGLELNRRQIKRARIKAGHTQRTLAWTIGVHPLTMARWESENTDINYHPSSTHLRAMARILKVKVQYFYEWPEMDRARRKIIDEHGN